MLHVAKHLQFNINYSYRSRFEWWYFWNWCYSQVYKPPTDPCRGVDYL